MRRYRRAPVVTARTRADDDEGFWSEWSMSKPTIDVYEAETRWEATGILDPDGHPMQAYVGPDPIGFVWFEDDE